MISQICQYSEELSTNYSRYSLIISFSCCSSGYYGDCGFRWRGLCSDQLRLLVLWELLRLMETSSSRCCISQTRSSLVNLADAEGGAKSAICALAVFCCVTGAVYGDVYYLLQISYSSSSSKPSKFCCWKFPLICGGDANLFVSLLLALNSALPSLISEMICRSEDILFLVAVLNSFQMMPSNLSLNFSKVSISFSWVRPTSFNFYSSSSQERCNYFNFLFSARSSYIRDMLLPIT